MNPNAFESLFKHSSFGVLVTDEEGTIKMSNQFVEKAFGRDPDEMIGEKMETLIPGTAKKSQAIHQTVMKQDYIPRSFKRPWRFEGIKKNGETLPVEVSLSYCDNDAGKQFISYINDTSSKVRAQDKIRERTSELTSALIELNYLNESLKVANENLKKEMQFRAKAEAHIHRSLKKQKELNELKSRFVSMASHEFRTPLGGISTSASLISHYNKPGDEQKRARHINIIKNSVKNLTNILNEFLSLDKLDRGILEIHPGHFCFNKLLDQTIDELNECIEHSHVIVVEADKDIALYQDQDFLRNIFINLVSNAVKYSPKNSTITIKAISHQDHLECSVEDEGIGIPQEDHPYLFGVFFRAKNVGNIEGTGLGLNIISRYISLMKGKIQFKSAINKGSTFTFQIPLEYKHD